MTAEAPFALNLRLARMKERVRNKTHARHRIEAAPDVLGECEAEGLSWMQRVARLLVRQCEAEAPVIEPDECIVFTRTTPAVPPIYSPEDWGNAFAGGRAHELGPISNICADWGMVLSEGLEGRKRAAEDALRRFAGDSEAESFLRSAVACIEAVLGLARRYRDTARRLGRDDVAEVLDRVPGGRPSGFRDALQALRLIHGTVWLCGHYHVGLGRFDQYLWPYLRTDLERGTLCEGDAEELLAEFFISLNKDTDLYPGIQQGDNGQSLMLGGLTRAGEPGENPLTCMVLRVARAVSMIDPKINLRVSRDTDIQLLELAAELTRSGLGFPQYSNDEVVIPGLVEHGYSLEDARDYSVAACWEYIVPGRGMDVVNIGAVSLPAAVNRGVLAGLQAGDGFTGILRRIDADIRRQTQERVDDYRGLILPPAPYYSALMTGCIERGRDVFEGLVYNNFGLHGACSSNAADALAAVRRFVFEEACVDGNELVDALACNWRDREALRAMMASGPRVGDDDEKADELLVYLFERFAEACAATGGNGRGGIVRPGTGSAMYYVWLARGNDGMAEPVVGATADGRRQGDFFSSSLAPSPGARVRGPFSVLRSYSKLDYRRLCNGGPITMELSDSVFRSPETVRKVAMLIRVFARLGCQQLQLNTLNVDTLRDARERPEQHRNLIVRVWGWSGYFCELAPEYQDHIIARHMHEFGAESRDEG
jgi:formate C-acetyltransferase